MSPVKGPLMVVPLDRAVPLRLGSSKDIGALTALPDRLLALSLHYACPVGTAQSGAGSLILTSDCSVLCSSPKAWVTCDRCLAHATCHMAHPLTSLSFLPAPSGAYLHAE
jgi:hypothetical protein